jgi:hypothetical protein
MKGKIEMTHIDLEGMLKELEDKSRGLENTMLCMIEEIEHIAKPLLGLLLPVREYYRWHEISKTDMQKAFMSLRRSIAECQKVLLSESD